MEKRHRIFIAINLPAEIKKELSLYTEKWPDLPAKWVKPDNLHITLEFLGQITDKDLAEVCSTVKEVAKRHRSFSINLHKVSYGPPKKMPPKIVWVEGEKSDEILDLKEDLKELLTERVDYHPDMKGFSPHITLARISEFAFRQIEPEERPEINEDIDLAFTVESIEVMESELRREGPEYVIVETHNLGE